MRLPVRSALLALALASCSEAPNLTAVSDDDAFPEADELGTYEAEAAPGCDTPTPPDTAACVGSGLMYRAAFRVGTGPTSRGELGQVFLAHASGLPGEVRLTLRSLRRLPAGALPVIRVELRPVGLDGLVPGSSATFAFGTRAIDAGPGEYVVPLEQVVPASPVAFVSGSSYALVVSTTLPASGTAMVGVGTHVTPTYAEGDTFRGSARGSAETVFTPMGTNLVFAVRTTSCVDGAKNGQETDVDCGGSTCGACADTLDCLVPGDCLSGVCTGNVCQAPTCTDSVTNGTETDVDCGGAGCGDCAATLHCEAATDCQSGVCTGFVCQAPTCSDTVQNGAETAVDCGGGTCAICPTVLIVGTGNDRAAGAIYQPGGSWSFVSLATQSSHPAALTFTTEGKAVALFRHTQVGNALDQSVIASVWTEAGGFSSASALSAGVVLTQGTPALASDSVRAYGAFHGLNFHYYLPIFTGSIWNPLSEEVFPTTVGPAAPGIAAQGDRAIVAFANGADGNKMYSVDRSAGGTWEFKTWVADAPEFNTPPRIVALAGTTRQLLVWRHNTGDQLKYAFRTGTGGWGWPGGGFIGANVPGATSPSMVSLAALPDGDAVLAFRGSNNFIYWARWNNVSSTWSTPAQVLSATSNVTPSISRGTGGSTYELAYTEAGGNVFHTRYVSGAWTTPALVLSNMANAVIAAGP